MSQANAAHVDLTADDAQLQAVKGRTARSLESIRRRMEGVSRTARRMLLVGAGAIAGFVKLAADQESATRRLESALDAAGESSARWSGELLAASNRIQDVTTHGNESVQMLMAQAVNMGVAADQLEDTAKQAIGLARAYDMDLNQALRAITQANAGHFDLLRRYDARLRTAADSTEAMAIVQEAAARGFQQAQDDTRTLSGAIAQLRNDAGDAAKEIGGAFLPNIERLTQRLREQASVVAEWAANNADLIIRLTGVTAAVLGLLAVLPKLLGIFAALHAHPVIFAVTALTAAVIGLAAAFNDGEIAGFNLGHALHRLAADLGLVRGEALKLLDAEQRLNAETERIHRLQDQLEQAEGPRRQLEIVERLIDAERERLDLQREIHRTEESERQRLEERKRNLEDFIEREKEFGRGDDPFDWIADVEKDIERTTRELEKLDEAFRVTVEAPREQEIADLTARADELREALKPEEEPARSFFDTVRDGFDDLAQQGRSVWQQFADAMRQAQRELAEGRADFAQRLELFGAEAQQRQLIMLQRTRDQLEQQARELGILTEDMEREIARRFEAERGRILGDRDDAPPGDQDRTQRTRFESGPDMFRRIAAAAATPNAAEQRIQDATERTARATESLLGRARRDQERQREAFGDAGSGSGGADDRGNGLGALADTTARTGDAIKRQLGDATKIARQQLSVLQRLEQAIPTLGTFT